MKKFIRCMAVVLFSSAMICSCEDDTDKNSPPSKPSNPTPAHQALGISIAPTLLWDCSDPDSDPLTYDVYLDKTPNPTTKIATGISNKSLTGFALESATIYYWKVVAKDSEGNTSEGGPWSFMTFAAPGS